jgi:hypothetical protein
MWGSGKRPRACSRKRFHHLTVLGSDYWPRKPPVKKVSPLSTQVAALQSILSDAEGRLRERVAIAYRCEPECGTVAQLGLCIAPIRPNDG